MVRKQDFGFSDINCCNPVYSDTTYDMERRSYATIRISEQNTSDFGLVLIWGGFD